MRIGRKQFFVTLVAVLGLVSLGTLLYSSSASERKPEREVLRSRRIGTVLPADGRKGERVQRVPVAQRPMQNTYGAGLGKVKILEFNEEDEHELNDAARDLIAALRRALDHKDYSEVLRLAKYLQQTSPQEAVGLSRLPVALKRRLIEALGYCGAEAIPEIMTYLTDSDPEIVDSAFNEFRKMLRDFRLGDRDRAVIVTESVKVLTDAQELRVMMAELNTMRHSVFVDTVLAINKHGTSEAQELLGDSVNFYTGKSLETEESLLEWLEAHPDGARDEAFYGGWGR